MKEYVKLSEVCNIIMGQSPESNSYNELGNGLPFFQGNADFGELYPVTKMWCTEPKKIVEKNTLLISVRAPIGALNFSTERCCIGRGLAGITAKAPTDLKYIYYGLMNKKEELNRLGTGSTFKAINKKVLENTLIVKEKAERQHNIVKVLDKNILIIAHLQKQLYLLDELVKSRFIEMFGDINVNNRGWTIQPLGELCTIVRGGSPRPIEKFLGGDVPWIKIGDATDGESIYLYSTKEHIIREGVSKSRMIKGGSLIFANCGVSLGFARIITFDGCIHDGWLAMEDIDARLDKVFLLQSLNQMTEHFRKIAPAGTQPNLNTAIMKAYKQIIPPMKLQKDFIAFVEQTDKSRLAIQKSLDETQLLFDSLMQKYFG